jgi:hypothetical protein
MYKVNGGGFYWMPKGSEVTVGEFHADFGSYNVTATHDGIDLYTIISGHLLQGVAA